MVKFLFKMRIFIISIKNAFISLIRHDGFELSGYLAFLTFIAIFPCTIFLAKLAEFISYFLASKFGQDAIINFLVKSFDEISDLPINTLKKDIKKILTGPPKSIVNFAILGILWTSSSTMQGMKMLLNRAYRVDNTQNYFLGRFYSMIQFALVSFITIIIISIIHLVPIIVDYLNDNFDYYIGANIFHYFNYFKSTLNICILTAYVVLLNIMLPSKKYRLKSILPGAIITIILWLISSKILMIYFTKFIQFNIVYGGLANIISILLFFYIIFVCFIFGAEFNYFYEKNKSELNINE